MSGTNPSEAVNDDHDGMPNVLDSLPVASTGSTMKLFLEAASQLREFRRDWPPFAAADVDLQ
jgi:hypothetical protein